MDSTTKINAKNTIYGRKLVIDKNAFINYENYFDCTDEIHIGKNVWIGMRCIFITATHEIEGGFQRAWRVVQIRADFYWRWMLDWRRNYNSSGSIDRSRYYYCCYG